MAIQVHSATKPTKPGRTVAVAALVFGVTCLLAVDMSRRRRQQTLAPRYAPPGWGVSYQPPKRFIPAEMSRTTVGGVILYSGMLSTGVGARMAVWRVEHEARIETDDLCLLVLSQYEDDPVFRSPDSVLGKAAIDLPPPAQAWMGDRNAVERFNDDHSVVVRATAGTRSGYAISMVVSHAPLDADAYRIFDLACKSFEFASDR